MLADKVIVWQSLIFAALYFLLAFGMLLLFRYGGKKWRQFKIDHKSADAVQLRREILFSFSSLIIFINGGFLTWWLYNEGFTRMYLSADERGYFYTILSFFLTLLLHDFYFYWTHRFMHLPGIYSAIHKTHHLSHHTTVFSALSFHPGEAVIQVAFIPLVTLLIPLHPMVLYGFIFYNLLVNILGHSGYEFFPEGFKKSLPGRYSNTPLYHYVHHRFVKKNYGLYSSFWDKVMGTYNKDTEKIFNQPSSRLKSNAHESDI